MVLRLRGGCYPTFIRFEDGSVERYHPAYETIFELKKLIEKKHGTSAHLMKFYCDGEELLNELTVGNYVSSLGVP